MIVEKRNVDLDFGVPILFGVLVMAFLSIIWVGVYFLNYYFVNTITTYPLGVFLWTTILGFAVWFLHCNFKWYTKQPCIICSEQHYVFEMNQLACKSFAEKHHEVYVCKRHKSFQEALA